MATRNKRTWTAHEDTKLLDALMELHASRKYGGADNGFKPSYFQAMEALLDVSLLNSGFKAEPHIKSRLKTFKNNFSIVHDVINMSGFSWDSEKCCVIADGPVWEDYIKSHKGATQFKDKPFPLYNKLSIVFGKDRATGARAVDLGDDDIPITNAPVDIEVSDIDLDLPQSQEAMCNKRKRRNSLDFDRTYMESAVMLNNSFTTFGNTLSTDMRAVASDGTPSIDLMIKVVKELNDLSSITLNERIMAMDVIGNSSTRAEMFFMLDEAGNVKMIQMVGRAFIDGLRV